MAFFEHDGCALHYEEYGQGEPLLLVHGLGSSAQDWEYQIPALAPHYRLIVVDLRGHGRSEKPRERYSIEGFAADLAALLERLGTGRVHYVGLSMGGMTGFQLAVDHPTLLKSLTIVNSTPEVKVRKPDDYWQWFKRWSLMHLVSMGAIGKGLGKSLFPLPEQAELRRKISERWARNDKRAYIASFNAIVGWGVQERIGQIRCPTLIISADHDYTPVSLKEQYVKLIPQAKLAVITNSRHATPLDQPEHFNRTLQDFLASVSATPKDPRVPC
ncbi:alpha/beta hydrolase [Pseudomonas sp. M47T1]|uniref:alpha/beta fold hydrolase n=1 Tax=Pseudomonas sp. M47T1 TaxID=1179778 RepID=UPI0002606C64|nr:alpha/beta hydrolase [Pseudomonas sp. M47T1]EIK94706.1 alpha/beta hydrolase [Pseudomonas sp. M47T1]